MGCTDVGQADWWNLLCIGDPDRLWGRQTGGSYCVGGPDRVYGCGAVRLVEPSVYRRFRWGVRMWGRLTGATYVCKGSRWGMG